MKIKTLLIAVVLVLGLAATASAATQWTVGASPEPLRVATGYTEKVGAISFNTVNNVGATVTGTITIDYHQIITVPASDILVRFTCGGVTPCPTIDDNTFAASIEENDDGDLTRVVLNVVPVPELEYSFIVDGVRIDVTGLLGAGAAYFDINVNATVIASENQITNGQANALVLQRIMPAFGTLTNTTAEPASIVEGIDVTEVTLIAPENFRNAFWKLDNATGDDTQTTVQRIYIKPVGTIPTGITITFPDFDSTGIWQLQGSAVLPNATNTITYMLYANSNVNVKENFQLAVDVAAVDAVTRGSVYPVDTKVYLTIDLGPFPAPAAAPTNIPRYLTDPKRFPNSVINFEQDFTKTILMVPYASAQGGFDTGLAVANTTLDPWGSPLTDIIGGALEQSGKIVFYLYPNNGTPGMVDTSVTYTVPLPTGKPLDATGKLPAGKTYSILLSQLIASYNSTASGATPLIAPETFEGYILVVCDFTNAHGQYFVAADDFSGFSNGAVMLVVDGAYRATNIPESFGQ